MKRSNLFFALSLSAFVLAYGVVVLGAYVRLSDAGLGCPDWPGCYGKMIVPGDVTEVDDHLKPDAGTIHQGKAWKEMVHRYAAGTLGMVIFLLAVLAWRGRVENNGRTKIITAALAALVVFQALLGMWTVTLLLKPIVVMAHLLGGLTILALLHWLLLRETPVGAGAAGSPKLTPWVVTGLTVLVLQISLGGWTSSNYAALICPEFPTCRGGEWLPTMDFKEGFILWRGLGENYEGGVLDAAARTAIHIAHRAGAVLTLLVLAAVAVRAFMTGDRRLRLTGAVLAAALILQVSLGIANIVYVLPLSVAVAHNGVAALLLLCLVTLLHCSLRDHK